MGCRSSKLASAGSSKAVPTKIAPLLRRRLENIRRRHRVADAMTLKESTLSSKQLLKDSSSTPDSSEDTSSRLSTCKRDCGRDEDSNGRNSLCCSDHPPSNFNDVVCKPEKLEEEEISMKKSTQCGDGDCDDIEREKQKVREEKVLAAVAAAIEQVLMEEESIYEEAKELGDDSDNDDEDQLRVLSKSLLQDDHIYPGSFSFRVYCKASMSAHSDNDTDRCPDVDDAPKVTSKTKLVNSDEEHEETVIRDKNKSIEIKVKRSKGLMKVIGRKQSGAMKNLLNVKSCYCSSCSSHDRTRLLSEKAAS